MNIVDTRPCLLPVHKENKRQSKSERERAKKRERENAIWKNDEQH